MPLNYADTSGNGMGVSFVNRAKVDEVLNAVETTTSARMRGTFNASLDGTFVATLQIERSYDNGVTWNPLTAMGLAITFSVPCEEIFSEPESGVLYRWNCVAYTSGNIEARISQ